MSGSTRLTTGQRTSVLAAFSFLSGLAAAVCVTTAWFLVYLAGLQEVRQEVRMDDMHALLLAARIVAGVTVGPAVISLAFWLAARGAVRDAQGGLMGRGLYRSGVIVSVLSVVFALCGNWSVTAKIDRALEDAKVAPEEVIKRSSMVRTTASLVETLEAQEDDAARITVLGGALRAGNHRLAAAQIHDICRAFNQDSGRLEAIKLCAPRLEDPENADVILETLEYSSTRELAKKLLEKKPAQVQTTPAPRQPEPPPPRKQDE